MLSIPKKYSRPLKQDWPWFRSVQGEKNRKCIDENGDENEIRKYILASPKSQHSIYNTQTFCIIISYHFSQWIHDSYINTPVQNASLKDEWVTCALISARRICWGSFAWIVHTKFLQHSTPARVRIFKILFPAFSSVWNNVQRHSVHFCFFFDVPMKCRTVKLWWILVSSHDIRTTNVVGSGNILGIASIVATLKVQRLIRSWSKRRIAIRCDAALTLVLGGYNISSSLTTLCWEILVCYPRLTIFNADIKLGNVWLWSFTVCKTWKVNRYYNDTV